MNRLANRAVYSPHSYYVEPIESSLGNAIIFLIPTLTFLEFRLIGRLFLSEIILICLLPFLLFVKGWMLRDPLAKKLLFLGLLWLFAQVITDLIRGTPFEDYSRGWSKIAFFLAHFACLYMLLYGNRKRLVLFALGLAFSGLLAYKFKIDSPFSYARAYPWKFGVGGPITLLLILFSTTNFVSRARLLPSLILLLLGILNVYMGFRSLGGICFLTGVYIFVQQRRSTNLEKTIMPSLGKTIFISILAVVATVGFLNAYVYTAEHGWLGKRAKVLVQSQSGSFGVLLGGRIGIYSASRAIIDSPLIGHGSWAKNPYYVRVLKDLEKFGYKITSFKKLYKNKLIPTHSHLLGSWVESGILGALFWGWVLALTAKALFYQYNTRDVLTPLIAFIGIRFVWDILLSPFGAERRLTTAFFLVLLMSALGMVETHKLYKEDDNALVPSR